MKKTQTDLYVSKKRAQIWGLDLMTAVFLFIIAIVVFLIYTVNYSGEAAESFERLKYDGDNIMKVLLSEGSPKDWKESDVIRIGLTTENKINETKLEQFYTLAKSNYSLTKIILNTRYDYYFFLDEKMLIQGEEIEGIGKPNVTEDTITAHNLIKITRFGIYGEKPVTLYLYIWE